MLSSDWSSDVCSSDLRHNRRTESGATPPMLLLNQIDPIALQLGPLAVHWYGLMYLLGFAVAWYLGQRRIRAGRLPGVDANAFGDLLFYGLLGVMLGGRIGYILRSEEHTSELQSLMRISYAV